MWPEVSLKAPDYSGCRCYCFIFEPILTIFDFPHSSAGKKSTCNAGDPCSIPGLGKSAGEGTGYPLEYSWSFLVAQLVKNPPAMWETWVQSLVGMISSRRERLPTPVFWPGEFHGLYSLRSHKESDTTERFPLSLTQSSGNLFKKWLITPPIAIKKNPL